MGDDCQMNLTARKIIWTILAPLVCIFSYASFAHDAIRTTDIPVDPSTVRGSIVYYSHFNNFVADGHYKKWVDDFKKLYPNVKDVKIELLTDFPDFRNHMGALMAGGSYGDVVEIMDSMSQNDYEIFFEPLNSLGIQNVNIFPDQFYFEGKYYGFGYGVNADAVVYNKTLFAKAGIDRFPRTRTELFAACAKLKSLGVIPFQLNMPLGWPMQQWDKETLIFADDGDYFAKLLNDPAPFSRDKPYGKMLTFVRALIDKGCVESNLDATDHFNNLPTWQSYVASMASGKIGMWFLANWSIQQILDAARDNHTGMVSADLGFAPLPVDDSGDAKVLIEGDIGLAVSAQSTNKPTAKAFLYYLLNITDLAEVGGFIPGNVNSQPTLPQIAELKSLTPAFIKMVSPSADVRNAMAAAGFDFMTGIYLRSPLLAKDFDAALSDMNRRWATAIGRH
jgi:ABC-type glycerol-3-phosphate transport system substrate-binding protein